MHCGFVMKEISFYGVSEISKCIKNGIFLSENSAQIDLDTTLTRVCEWFES